MRTALRSLVLIVPVHDICLRFTSTRTSFNLSLLLVALYGPVNEKGHVAPVSLLITITRLCIILRLFTSVKNYNFQMKHSDIFSYFCSKHRSCVLVRTAPLTMAVITSTHELRFRANIRRKNHVYPCTPQLLQYKSWV